MPIWAPPACSHWLQSICSAAPNQILSTGADQPFSFGHSSLFRAAVIQSRNPPLWPTSCWSGAKHAKELQGDHGSDLGIHLTWFAGDACSRRSAAVSHSCGFAVASFRSCRGAIVAGWVPSRITPQPAPCSEFWNHIGYQLPRARASESRFLTN